jgi:hypothetical protein
MNEVSFPEVESTISFPEVEAPAVSFPEVETPAVSFPEVEQEQPQEAAPGKPQAQKPVTPVGDTIDAITNQMNSWFGQDPKAAPAQQERTIGGFAKNILPSIGKNVRDIGKGILLAPVMGVKAASDLYREASKPDQRWKNETSAGKMLKDVFGGAVEQVGDSLIDKYAEAYYDRKGLKPHEQGGHGAWVPDPENPGHLKKDESTVSGAIGRAAYEDPMGVALDVAAAKDILAAGGKAVGKTARMAGDLSAARKAEAAMEAVKPGAKAIEAGLEATAKPNIVQRVGGAIEKGSELFDTAGSRAARAVSDATMKGLNKVSGGWLGAADPEARRLALRLKGEEGARAAVKAAEDERSLVPAYQSLSKEEIAALEEVKRLGDGASPKALDVVHQNPIAIQAAQDYADYVSGVREDYMKANGLKNDAALKTRVAAQYAIEKGWGTKPGALKKAAAEIDQMKQFKPTYVPTRAEAASGMSMEKVLAEPSTIRQGKVGFLERFKGQQPFASDPFEYIPKMAKDFRKTEGNIRWLQRIQDEPSLVAAKTAKEARGQEPIFTQGAYSKYFDEGGKYKAQGIFQRQLVNEHGDRAFSMMRTPAVQKRIAQISKIVPNETVGRILKLEFSKWANEPGMLIRGWDKINNVFKTAAIKYNPHYYSGNAVGDAVLSLLAGVTPGDLRLGDKLKEFAPFQARRAASVHSDAFTGRFGKAMDWINDVDAAGKRGIITKEVAAKLTKAGISRAELEAELQRVLPSVEKYADAQVARSQAHEILAKRREALSKATGRGKAAAQAKYDQAAAAAQEIEKTLPQLRVDAELVRPAIERANQFFADYHGLGPIEQYVLRRIYPFYAFNKAMFTLAVKLPAVAPKMGATLRHFADYMIAQTNEDDRPGRLKGYTQTGFKGEGGKPVSASFESLSPFGGLKPGRLLNVDIPGWMDPLQSPIVAAGYGAMGGKTVYSSPYGGGDVVPSKGGKGYETMPDGSIRKVVPQSGILETAGKMAPILPQLERAIFPNGAGVFTPEAAKKRGTDKPLNTKDHLDALLSSIGLKTVTKTVGEMKQEKMPQVYSYVQDAIDDIKRAGPEERQKKVQQLRTWLKTKRIAD